MNKQRETGHEGQIHRATSADGTEITATAQGEGPPLILLPAGPADSGTAWGSVLPSLTECFTCHLLAPRGWGRSGHHPDQSPDRIIEDIAAYAESLAGPVTLVEWGSFLGAAWSLFAARSAPAVQAVASFDPLVLGVAAEKEAAQLDGIFERISALVEQGRIEEAAVRFPREMAEHGFYTEVDMAGGATTDLWAASTDTIPVFFEEMAQAHGGSGPDPADPVQLAEVGVPVLLLHGTRSHPLNREFVRFVAGHLPEREVRAIEGAGHYGPMTHPEEIAQELVGFLEGARTAA